MKLFYMGGPLFMGILTAILIIMVAWAVYHFLPVLTGKEINLSGTKSKLKHIKTIGTLALIFGIFGQLIGLYQAFDVLMKRGDVSQSLLAGGLKVSMIPTLYGIIIFILSLLLWLVFDFIVTKKSE
ncbi:MAG TPA: MotA/TolQ/ExbB proton channel family protein [Draconibacterium sp.]|nr:MotA/TolQ/ExbB proton channel family protein [Draconibacterium sp.]